MTTNNQEEPNSHFGWRCPNCKSMNEPWAGSCVCGTQRQMVDGNWVYSEPGDKDNTYKGELLN